MLTFKEFDGINNVLHAKRMRPSEFVRAVNVDVGNGKELTRRQGYSQASPNCHKNLFQAQGFMLATCDGDLTAIWPDTTRVMLYESLGVDRVWYCNLPDGRTAFSNGLIQGITDGLTITGWGVPIPETIGTVTPIGGLLYAGDYQYQIAYVRDSDGREGGPAYSNAFPVAAGGVWITGLPVRDGYSIRVYLTSLDGGEAYYAGTTTTDKFQFSGANYELTIPARLDMTYPCPSTATVSAMSRGRVLVADGSVLYASRVGQPEVFDIRRDFKQFTAPITLIQPVNDGVYVGTENELAFLAGTEFDKLQLVRVMHGRVALGSGVTAPGEKIKVGDSVGRGVAMMCLVDGGIVAGFDGGSAIRLTENRYKTTAAEVAATYRESNGIPQYIAIPQ